MSELKTCPICLQPLTPKTINGEVDYYMHPFSRCFLSSTVVFKEQIDLWNTRTTLDKQDVIEVIKNEIEDFPNYGEPLDLGANIIEAIEEL